MKKFGVVISAMLFLPTCSFLRANAQSKTEAAEAVYQNATLVKMTASVWTRTREALHAGMLDSALVSEKIVTYMFTVRLGTVLYTSRYTPEEQREKLPNEWWKGNVPIKVRIANHKLLVERPGGAEIASRIVSQRAVTK